MQKLLGKAMPLGSVMLDVAGTTLTAEDKERLLDPLVAGVILFSRNFESVEQLQKLTQQIHDLRHPKLLIGVDHEGGRVQRFKTGFTRLPPMRWLGKTYDNDPDVAKQLAEQIGWLLATELLSVGVDFSFAPVLDLDYGESRVIGDRALHANPKVVGELGFFLMKGMHEAGMPAVAKHFPGHGYVEADTHHEIAIDSRDFETIKLHDLQPFLTLIENGVEAMMPAHVIYPQVDDLPAGFSKRWLQGVLRDQCHFMGAIISDDLSMQAAAALGAPAERARLALEAGCDLVLFCNDSQGADEIRQHCQFHPSPLSHARLIRLHGHPKFKYDQLAFSPQWQAAQKQLQKLSEYYEGQLF
jgi:beta-N-acetylhexosaminidase